MKADLTSKGIYNDSMQAVVKGTRATLSLDGAVLPETEFTLFLVPGKMKSGARAKLVDSISELGLRELKKLLKHANYRGKANDKKSIIKYLRTKGYGKMSSNAINEIVLTKAAKAKAKAEATAPVETATATSETGLSVDEAQAEIKEKLSETKKFILDTIAAIKVQTINEGVDLFKGLEAEFDEIASEVQKG